MVTGGAFVTGTAFALLQVKEQTTMLDTESFRVLLDARQAQRELDISQVADERAVRYRRAYNDQLRRAEEAEARVAQLERSIAEGGKTSL